MLSKLDGRSKEGRLVSSVRQELTRHVGGSPSITQRAMIERAALLHLHISMMDRKVCDSGLSMTEHDSRTYLAWVGSLARILDRLGLAPAPAPAKPAPKTLGEMIAVAHQ